MYSDNAFGFNFGFKPSLKDSRTRVGPTRGRTKHKSHNRTITKNGEYFRSRKQNE